MEKEITVFYFNNGLSMDSEKINSCIEDVFKTLKKELPQELQTYEVIKFLLEEAKENLKLKNVIL